MDDDESFDATGAHLQYDDYVGTIAIDDMSEMQALLARLGVDHRRWIVFGVSLFLLRSGSGRITLYLVDRDELPEGGNVSDLVHDQRLPVREESFDDPGGVILREALLAGVKGTHIELVRRRVRQEGWRLVRAESA